MHTGPCAMTAARDRWPPSSRSKLAGHGSLASVPTGAMSTSSPPQTQRRGARARGPRRSMGAM